MKLMILNSLSKQFAFAAPLQERSIYPREICARLGSKHSDRQASQDCSLQRRDILVLGSALGWMLSAGRAGADGIPGPPPVGNCADCIGELNTTLNACTLSSTSCVSTQNEDEDHFLPPWQYDGPRADAVERLINVATGGDYTSGPLEQPFGISRSDAAKYILGGVGAVLRGEKLPEKPERQRAAERERIRYDGQVADRHSTEDGSDYVRIVFGLPDENNPEPSPSEIIDAEFLFLSGDNIVDIRAASRAEPGRDQQQLSLSLSQGIIVDRNLARRRLEAVRKSLGWDSATVITDFDPRFNNSKPLFFERLYRPFVNRAGGGDAAESGYGDTP